MSITSALDTSWKVNNELRRYLAWPYIRLYFARRGVAWGQKWRVFGTPLIQRHRNSQIHIGAQLEMRNWFGSNPLGVNHRCILATWTTESVIEIGDAASFTGVTLCAASSIIIGRRVRIGANSTITDTDFHPLELSERRLNPHNGQTDPVIIEDDVFIGMHALILKGSHIGRGSVIGAGSVVAGCIPAEVIVAGNPARIVRELAHD
jgi:acetyltransferase-like isoleucine patch superfamily enzyme